MSGQQVDHLVALVLAAAPDPMAEDDLVPAVVDPLVEEELRLGLPRVAHRPAGEAAGDLGHVLLRVAAVDAEGVQLHDLARVVLVEPPLACRLSRGPGDERPPAEGAPRAPVVEGRGVGVGGEPVVEVEEHRRALRRGPQQVLEFPPRVRAHDVALVLADHELHRPLAREHVEVVHPEVGHHLVELPLAVDGPEDIGRLQLLHDLLRRPVHPVPVFLHELSLRLPHLLLGGAVAVGDPAARSLRLGIEPSHLLGEDLRLLGEPRGGDREVEQEHEDDAQGDQEQRVRR